VKILIDMNLSPHWEAVFHGLKMEAAHWTKLGAIDAPDAEIMSFAARENFVVLTHDLDFGAILAATGGAMPSVVQIRGDDLRPASIGPRVAKALLAAAREIEAGVLITIDVNRVRLRILPLAGPSSKDD
jgi:predicted nuclease of predicted toxin-antitoxin system